MSWAYSPSYGKPLSVAQGIIGLMSRFGVDLTLAYPEKYHLMPEIEEKARNYSNACGGSFTITHSMEEAFSDADVVYPKSWASYHIMEQRTKLFREGDTRAYQNLEKEALAENKQHVNWECNSELMKSTKNGKALYMHCLPADISGESCEQGEVTKNVFAKYRKDMYLEARNKPFVIAAMILLSQLANPVAFLKQTIEQKKLLQF